MYDVERRFADGVSGDAALNAAAASFAGDGFGVACAEDPREFARDAFLEFPRSS